MTTPAARPILFSAPMVRALLEGRKTQTRRLVKGLPVRQLEHDKRWFSNVLPPSGSLPNEWSWWDGPPHGHSIYHSCKCPYGVPGDLLWVRETWADDQFFGEKLYRATHAGDDRIGGGWRSSIHMPRLRSRLTLALTDIRIERLQKINKEDAIAEGCGPVIPDDLKDHPLAKHVGPDPRTHYAALWVRLNGETGPASWGANPWVWVLSFDVHRANVDSFLEHHHTEAAQ